MKTHIEISKQNLIHNLGVFKKISQKKVMFVVKANAYGHGLKEIIGITKDISSIDYYAVDSLEEALVVQKIDPHKKIILLGWMDDQELREVIANQFETVAPSLDFINKANQFGQELKLKARIHIKLETGTARLGMDPRQVIEIFQSQRYPHLDIVGLYSHFANIEDTTDHSYAQKQLQVFNKTLTSVPAKKLLKHFSCSASTLLFPKTYFDIVRVGISAYGYWPSKQTYISYIEKDKAKIQLKPVLSWFTKVAQVKDLKRGDSIGYGITYRTFNHTKIIVIPVGYYDGYDRRLSNISTLLVNGIKAPVRGRICMDMLMAEVTHIKKVKAGDKVTLIGGTEDNKIDADYLGELTGTINYEILSRLNPLIPRVVVS